MTLFELFEATKTLLETMPPDSQVIIQKDAEGNGYSPLSAVDGDAIYTPDSTWSGDVASTNWTWQEACRGSAAEWEEFKAENPRCVVLAPVN